MVMALIYLDEKIGGKMEANKTEILYHSCENCGGVVTQVIKYESKGNSISTICRTCGRVSQKIGIRKAVVQGGYGSYCIFYKNSDIQDFGSLNKKVDLKELDSIILEMKKNQEIDFDKTYVIVRKNNKLFPYLGKIPLTYDELKVIAENQENEQVITSEQVEKLFEDIFIKKTE